MDDELPALSRRQVLQASAAALGSANALQLVAEAKAEDGPFAMPLSARSISAADYVVARLKGLGCTALFGVPGSTCDPLFDAAHGAGLSVITTASDLEAGYAADGYARVKNIALLSVTYGPGSLSLVAAIGAANVERSPVVLVSGGPSAEDIRRMRAEGSLFSHSAGRIAPRYLQTSPTGVPANYDLLTDLRIFRQITAYAERAEKQSDVARIVDEALTVAITEQRPVYIEIAKDVWDMRIPPPAGAISPRPPATNNEQSLARSILSKLAAAERPAVLLGIEVERYGLQDDVVRLLRKLALPWSTTLVAKSVVSEVGAGFVGVYDGPRAPALVKQTIENSDFLLALGPVYGRQYRTLAEKSFNKTALAVEGRLRIGSAAAVNANLGKLIAELNAAPWTAQAQAAAALPAASTFEERRSAGAAMPKPKVSPPVAEPGLTNDELMSTVSRYVDEQFVLMTDTSLSMYPAADVPIKTAGGFLCDGVWQAIGYSLGAAAGVGIAEQHRAAAGAAARRPLVVTGDGGFQMTVQALSTLVRHKVRAVIVVIDNGLYAIEQFVIESTRGISPGDDQSYFKNGSVAALPHVVLPRWDYVALAKAMGISFAAQAATVADLQTALTSAKSAAGPALIAATVKQRDLPSELRPS